MKYFITNLLKTLFYVIIFTIILYPLHKEHNMALSTIWFISIIPALILSVVNEILEKITKIKDKLDKLD